MAWWNKETSPTKLWAEHLGLLQPAVALSDAALLQGRALESWLGPLAAGCIAKAAAGCTQSIDFVGNGI